MVKSYDPKRCGQLPDKTYDNLSLHEVVCMVCRGLAYPPVTLPCDHLFCNECYDRLKEQGDFLCPHCRKRFGIWDRRRKNEVVNVNLQQAMWKVFPEKIELKISGKDDGVAEELQEKDLAESRRISLPGEVKRDYILALEEENREREKEQIASEKYVEEIQKEDEKIADELRKLEEEDAEIAQAIFQQEEEEYRHIREEKAKLEKLDKELALNLVKEQGEARVLPPKIVQRNLDSYLSAGRNMTSDAASASGSGDEEPGLIPSNSIKPEPEEPWFEVEYVQAQIERDRMLAIQIHKEIELELQSIEKKRKVVSEYSLRSSSKKKKSGKPSPRKQIKLDSMLGFKPRRLSY